jgi:hypothetical protein
MRLLFILGLGLSISLVYSCANDNLESLTPRSIETVKTDSTTTTTSTNTTTSNSTNTSTNSDATVSFSKDIQPILSKYACANCHGNGYYNYTGVSSLARSGQLLGTMSWASGFRRMPPNQKASASELNLISTWIKEGTLNN